MASSSTMDGSQSQGRQLERQTSFLPVPERVSQYLELKTAEVASQMQSTKGRESLYKELLKHEKDIRKTYPNFDAEELRTQLEEIGETLASKERFLEEMKPKKGIFRRALDSVGGFVKKHPIATVILLLATATGAVAVSAYMAGGMEALLAEVGLSHLYGSAGAAKASEALGKVIEGGKNLFPDVYDAPAGGEMF